LILVGTSGWSYDDWVGPVYPKPMAGKPEAWLSEYARRFPTVEVNSTFYRLPPPATVRAWIDKARALGGDFEYSAKVPQDVTHRAMVAGDDLAMADGVEAFHREVAKPLSERGLFGAALLQLAPRFAHGERETRSLSRCLGLLAARGIPAAVEFRNPTWVTAHVRSKSPSAAASGSASRAPPGSALDAPAGEDVLLAGEARDALREHGAALAAVDGCPWFPRVVDATGPHAYFRFHGRNPGAWETGSEEAEGGRHARYDYVYGPAELAPLADEIRAASRKVRATRAYFNNHPGGKAVRNALETMGLLGETTPHRRAGQSGLAEF